jgi:hypothetical protein
MLGVIASNAQRGLDHQQVFDHAFERCLRRHDKHRGAKLCNMMAREALLPNRSEKEKIERFIRNLENIV